jgi:ATP-binding cassette subfamily B protein
MSNDVAKPPRIRTLLEVGALLRPYRLLLSFYVLAMLGGVGANLAIPQAARFFVDRALLDTNHLRTAVLLLLGVGAVFAVMVSIRYGLITWVGERVIADLRQKVFHKVIHLAPSFYEKRAVGEIVSRLGSDVAVLQTVLTSTFSMAIRGIVLLVGSVMMMFLTNVKLAALTLLVVPLTIFFILLMGRHVKRLSRKVQDAIAKVGADIEESLAGIRTVQAYGLQKKIEDRFCEHVEQSFAFAADRIKVRMVATSLIAMAMVVAMAIVILAGGHDVLQQSITAGEFTAFLMYAGMAAMVFGSGAEIFGSLQQAAGAGERLFELLRADNPIEDPQDPEPIPVGHGAIDFCRLFFAYPSRRETLALADFDLSIRAGETVALVGPSGAGKSTVMQLLLRFYDPDRGEILIDGTPIHRLTLSDLRALLAIVPQEPVIFSGTIAENIEIGRPGSSFEAIEQAAKEAQAHEFIATLPSGYDTYVGEKGVMLSGGQKQRLAIARAILKNPRILLLDEATSALDAHNERLIQEALATLAAARTTLIIAHRLATVQKADRIVVMQQGKIVEIGRHEDLLSQNGLYAHLAALQFSETPPARQDQAILLTSL